MAQAAGHTFGYTAARQLSELCITIAQESQLQGREQALGTGQVLRPAILQGLQCCSGNSCGQSRSVGRVTCLLCLQHGLADGRAAGKVEHACLLPVITFR